MRDLTTILIKKTTRDALKSLGVKGESYDSIIMDLVRGISND